MSTHDERNGYWLFNWLAQRRITNISELRNVIDSRSNLSELRDYALRWHEDPSSSKTECNLVAGSGLGLGHGLSCTNARCIIKKIDVLYRHAWHYFDYIYLPDAAGDLLRRSGTLNEFELDKLVEFIQSSMYLREIGAESITRYYSTSEFPAQKFDVPANKKLDGIWEELRREFLRHPERFEITPQGRTSYEIKYHDDQLEFSPTIDLDLKSIPKNQRRTMLRSLLAENMVERHRKSLFTSILAAQKTGGSLGSTIWSHEWTLTKAGQGFDENGIFFRMEFPSLQNVAVSDLIAIRMEHRDSFIAFRTALKKAVQELSTSHGIDRNDLSSQVVRDVVMPEMARLNNKLDAARQVLTKKSTIALAIAGVSTWCGVHLGLGVATSLGAGALAALGSGIKDAAYKYSEEKRDLDISDMSFLWKAVKCIDRSSK